MYFITICTHNREEILSKIAKNQEKVGAGLVPALKHNMKYDIKLTYIGKIIDIEIHNLEKNNPIRYVQKYFN